MHQKQNRSHKRTQMFTLIADFFSSSKTQKEFCKTNALNYNNFQYWLKQYRKQQKQKAHTQENHTPPKEFIPIKPSAFIPKAEYACIIEYPNGIKLILGQTPDVNILHALLNPISI